MSWPDVDTHVHFARVYSLLPAFFVWLTEQSRLQPTVPTAADAGTVAAAGTEGTPGTAVGDCGIAALVGDAVASLLPRLDRMSRCAASLGRQPSSAVAERFSSGGSDVAFSVSAVHSERLAWLCSLTVQCAAVLRATLDAELGRADAVSRPLLYPGVADGAADDAGGMQGWLSSPLFEHGLVTSGQDLGPVQDPTSAFIDDSSDSAALGGSVSDACIDMPVKHPGVDHV